MPIGVVPIGDVMRRCTLGWHGQVECKLDADWVKHVPSSWRRDSSCWQSKTSWQNTVSADMRLEQEEEEDIIIIYTV